MAAPAGSASELGEGTAPRGIGRGCQTLKSWPSAAPMTLIFLHKCNYSELTLISRPHSCKAVEGACQLHNSSMNSRPMYHALPISYSDGVLHGGCAARRGLQDEGMNACWMRLMGATTAEIVWGFSAVQQVSQMLSWKGSS